MPTSSNDSKQTKKPWIKRHKILSGIIGLFILICLIGALGSSNTPTASNTASKSDTKASTKGGTASDAATLPTVGQPARDGKFEFTVNSMKCGETQIGDTYINTTAQGVFCRLNLTVKNIANQSQSLDSDSQYLYNAKGQKYDSDSTATLYAAPDSSSWFTNVNPGNSVTGDIIFDIPKDQTPVTAELHDSSFSGGAKVSLQ